MGCAWCSGSASSLFHYFLGYDFSKARHVWTRPPPERPVPAYFPRHPRCRQSASARLSRLTNPHPPKLKSLGAVTANMQVASAEEVRRVEKGMSWLATTGSVTPFVGLFGTVWGIIDAFSGLGNAGAASLRAVAPGISEALLTTAAGLVTAIPAVIFYNQFLQNIKDLAQRLDTFTLEVAAQIEKTFS